jgi:hypothetical protein
MAAIEPRLIEKLEKLPRERLGEVEDFVEFLAAREERAAAAGRLADALARLDALNLPPDSEQQIAAEIRASREERRSGTRRT